MFSYTGFALQNVLPLITACPSHGEGPDHQHCGDRTQCSGEGSQLLTGTWLLLIGLPANISKQMFSKCPELLARTRKSPKLFK